MSTPMGHSGEKPANSETAEHAASDLTVNNPLNEPAPQDASARNGTTRSRTEAEEAADKLYEERIEDEYAKREGGA